MRSSPNSRPARPVPSHSLPTRSPRARVIPHLPAGLAVLALAVAGFTLATPAEADTARCYSPGSLVASASPAADVSTDGSSTASAPEPVFPPMDTNSVMARPTAAGGPVAADGRSSWSIQARAYWGCALPINAGVRFSVVQGSALLSASATGQQDVTSLTVGAYASLTPVTVTDRTPERVTVAVTLLPGDVALKGSPVIIDFVAAPRSGDLEVSWQTISLPLEGQSASLSVISGDPWTLGCDGTAPPAWLHADLAGGPVGQTVVIITADPSSTPRQATLSICSSYRTVTVTVDQQDQDPVPPPMPSLTQLLQQVLSLISKLMALLPMLLGWGR